MIPAPVSFEGNPVPVPSHEGALEQSTERSDYQGGNIEMDSTTRHARSRFQRGLGALVAGVALLVSALPAHAIPLELGLALDASGSIGTTNFNTVRNAYISVLQDTSIVPQDGTVAIGVVRFASSATTIFPTTVIDSTSITSLVSALTGMAYTGGGTNIGSAIDLLTSDITGNAISSDRQIIDVSTDGFGTLGTSVNDALTAGIDQINCLGIGPSADCTFIAGTGAFSETASGFSAVQDALRQKIARETGGTVPDPSTVLLLGIGFAALAYSRARVRRLS